MLTQRKNLTFLVLTLLLGFMPHVHNVVAQKRDATEIGDLQISPDQTKLAISYGSGCDRDVERYRVDVVDINTFEVISVLLGQECAQYITWSPDSTRIASSGSGDGIVRIWNVATGEQIGSGNAITLLGNHISWRADSSQIATTMEPAAYIRFFDGYTGEMTEAGLTVSSPLTTVGWHPTDPNLLITGDRDGNIQIRNAELDIIRTFNVGSMPVACCIWDKNNTSTIFFRGASGDQIGEFGIIDTASGEILERWSNYISNDYIYKPQLSSDGKFVFFSHGLDYLGVLDLSNGSVVEEITPSPGTGILYPFDVLELPNQTYRFFYVVQTADYTSTLTTKDVNPLGIIFTPTPTNTPTNTPTSTYTPTPMATNIPMRTFYNNSFRRSLS